MDTKSEVVDTENEIDNDASKSTAHDIAPIVAGDAGSTNAKSSPTPIASNDTEKENDQENAMHSERSHHEIAIDISTANDTKVTSDDKSSDGGVPEHFGFCQRKQCI